MLGGAAQKAAAQSPTAAIEKHCESVPRPFKLDAGREGVLMEERTRLFEALGKEHAEHIANREKLLGPEIVDAFNNQEGLSSTGEHYVLADILWGRQQLGGSSSTPILEPLEQYSIAQETAWLFKFFRLRNEPKEIEDVLKQMEVFAPVAAKVYTSKRLSASDELLLLTSYAQALDYSNGLTPSEVAKRK